MLRCIAYLVLKIYIVQICDKFLFLLMILKYLESKNKNMKFYLKIICVHVSCKNIKCINITHVKRFILKKIKYTRIKRHL